MFDFFKNFLRGTNSTEVEQQLAKRDGPVTWGNPYVEVYDAYNAVARYGSFTTADDIVITVEGQKLNPLSQTIVLSKGDRVFRHNGYLGSENIGLALSKWRKA